MMTDPDGATFTDALAQQAREHRLVLGLMASYWAVCFGVGVVYERPVNPFLYGPIFAAVFVMIGIVLVGRSAFSMRRAQTGSPVTLKDLYADVINRIGKAGLARLVLLLGGLSITISVFQSIKAMIPVIKPFAFDASFSALDRSLHGGFYPHEVLQPLLGYPLVTFAILVLYNLWLPLIFLVFVWQVLDASNPVLQRRYLVSFILAWALIGTLGAILLSSAGPAYYHRVLDLTSGLAPGEGPYGGLLDYYAATAQVVPLFLTDMHEMLWGFYQSGVLAPGAGISAMPSVHVALAVHMFLAMRHKGRRFGQFFGLYALVILLGSVHLGWHYAVDGYLGGTLVAAIWWFSGLRFGWEGA